MVLPVEAREDDLGDEAARVRALGWIAVCTNINNGIQVDTLARRRHQPGQTKAETRTGENAPAAVTSSSRRRGFFQTLEPTSSWRVSPFSRFGPTICGTRTRSTLTGGTSKDQREDGTYDGLDARRVLGVDERVLGAALVVDVHRLPVVRPCRVRLQSPQSRCDVTERRRSAKDSGKATKRPRA